MTSNASIAARLTLLVGVAACVAWPSNAIANTDAPVPKSFLLLHTYGQESMFRPVFDRALQQALNRRGLGEAEIYVETLESNRFIEDKYTSSFKSYLAQKYAGRKIDVVIAVWDRALNYMLANGDQLFPGAAVATVVTRPRTLPAGDQVSQITAGDLVLDTARMALKLHPQTQQIFVVDSTLQSNEDFHLEFADQLKPLASRVKVEFLRDLSAADIRKRVDTLPNHSIVLFGRQTKRSPTQSMSQVEGLDLVLAAAHVPVYVISDQLIGRGVVGGVTYKTEALAELVADSAAQLARGTQARDLALRESQAVPTVDWRQVQKWQIDAAALPPGTQVLFREYTFWEQNRMYIVGAVTVFLIQTGLIFGLLIQRARRRRAEGALRDNEHALQVSQEDSRRLAGRLIAAQETERAHIARELHDDLSQKVALLAMDIHQIALSEAPEVRARAKILSERTAEIGSDLHNLSYELHPTKLQILGLVTATELLCRDLSARHQLTIDFLHEQMPPNVPAEQSLCLFRITQEALQNVVKHSGSRIATVRLTGLSESLQLEISDTGKGFDTTKLGGGLGLLSMRERVNFLGGHIKIWSKPGAGTCVSVQVRVTSDQMTADGSAARIA